MKCKQCEREAYAEELTVDGFCSAACEEAWHRAHTEAYSIDTGKRKSRPGSEPAVIPSRRSTQSAKAQRSILSPVETARRSLWRSRRGSPTPWRTSGSV